MIDAILLCQSNCIIQILGVFSVDGDGLKMAKIQSAIPVSIQNMIRHTVSLTDYFIRKFAWNAKAFYNGKDICSRCTATSQILYDLTFRIAVLASVAGDFHHYLIPVLNSLGIFSRNKYIPGKFRVVTYHKTKVTAVLVGSHDLGHTSFQNFYYNSLTAFAFLRLFCDYNTNLILVHSRSGTIFRNKYVVVFPLDFHEAKALGMTDKGAFHRWTVRIFVLQTGKAKFRIIILVASAVFLIVVLIFSPAVTIVGFAVITLSSLLIIIFLIGMFLIFLPGTSLGAFFCIFPGTFTRKLLVTFFSFSTLLLFPALSSSYFGITSLGIQVSLSLCYQIIQNTVQIFLLVL